MLPQTQAVKRFTMPVFSHHVFHTVSNVLPEEQS